MRFRMGDTPGLPVFDLRQEIESATLDGAAVPVDELAPRDLGGGRGAEMRVLARPLPAGSVHELSLAYPLTTPAATDAVDIGWDGGALFDLWMPDLHAG